ncbi:MAG TPA: DUF2065 family protein [Mesorhizobium sp.]
MKDLVAAVGVLLVLEGLLYGGFPNAAKKLAEDVRQLPESVLRIAGVASMAVGVLIVWLARG